MNLSLSHVMAAHADRLTLTFHVVLASSVFVFPRQHDSCS